MPIRTVTYRQIQQAIGGLNCLLEGDGAFAFLDDLAQLRVARLARELDVRQRAFQADQAKAIRKYYKTRKVPTGVAEDGEPKFEERFFVPADDRWSHDDAVETHMEETVDIDVPEIRVSQLRDPETAKIPTGWYHGVDATGQREAEPRKLSPASLLMALDPFLVMDLEGEE